MQVDINPNSNLMQSVLQTTNFAQLQGGISPKSTKFPEAMVLYSSAIKKVSTKFEILNDELSILNNRNPILLIKSRVKKPESIVEKLNRRGLPITLESMVENIFDIGGIRVICSFVDDIFNVVEMFARQEDIRIISRKDYISNPKESGYRSYHMIVETPIYFSEKTKMAKLEVQIRTIAMEYWASLDHQMKYKKNMDPDDPIVIELRECADMIAETDRKMVNIRKRIEVNREDIRAKEVVRNTYKET